MNWMSIYATEARARHLNEMRGILARIPIYIITIPVDYSPVKTGYRFL